MSEEAQTSFKMNYKEDLAGQMEGVEADDIKINQLLSGSVIVQSEVIFRKVSVFGECSGALYGCSELFPQYIANRAWFSRLQRYFAFGIAWRHLVVAELAVADCVVVKHCGSGDTSL